MVTIGTHEAHVIVDTIGARGAHVDTIGAREAHVDTFGARDAFGAREGEAHVDTFGARDAFGARGLRWRMIPQKCGVACENLIHCHKTIKKRGVLGKKAWVPPDY